MSSKIMYGAKFYIGRNQVTFYEFMDKLRSLKHGNNRRS